MTKSLAPTRRPRRSAQRLLAGTRVRVRAIASGAELATDLGFVAGDDVWPNHRIVRLDKAARYHHADGSIDLLDEVRVAVDNLDLLDGPAS